MLIWDRADVLLANISLIGVGYLPASMFEMTQGNSYKGNERYHWPITQGRPPKPPVVASSFHSRMVISKDMAQACVRYPSHRFSLDCDSNDSPRVITLLNVEGSSMLEECTVDQ